MPFEMLTGRKPNLGKLCKFSSKVWVHNILGSKLDGRSCIGKWVGFDEESNAHRIYWPENGRVSVERSVKFDDKWVVIPREVMVEGERKESNPNSTHDTSTLNPTESSNTHLTPATDHPGGNLEPICDCDKHIRKESDYLKCLCEGEGKVDSRPNAPRVLRGMQLAEPGGVEDAAATAVDEWEMVDVLDFESGMAAAVAEVEACEPSMMSMRWH
jgi:hypothetical protein